MEPVYSEYYLQLTILDIEFYSSDLCQLLQLNLKDNVFAKEIRLKPVPYNYRDFDRMTTIQIIIMMKEIETIFSVPDREYNDLLEFEFVLTDTEKTLYSPLKYTISNIDGMVKARNFGFIDQRRIRLLSMISDMIHKLSYDSIIKLEIMIENQAAYSLDLVAEFDKLSQNDLVHLLIRSWERSKHRKWIYTEYILDKLSKGSLSKIVMINPHQRLVNLARKRL